VEGVALMSVLTGQPAASAYQVHLVRRPQPRWLGALFWVYLAFMVPYLVWRCTIVRWDVWFGPPALAADLFAAVSFLVFLGHARHLYEPEHRPADLGGRVVDCLIPTHTEAVDLIEPTVMAAVRVRGVRRVIVLGNWTRDEVREMAERHGAGYHARDANEHGKAGNLNNGLRFTDAELVLTLDADHLPVPEFLERTVGYFDDPRVAFVQTPQSFYNTESIVFRRVRGRTWLESDMFYRCVQISKNRWNSSFYVGTSAVLRRAALDDVGGFATGTVTEDIHTALRIHAQGWRSVYLPEALAFGLEAQSLKEFHAQRRRWSVGGLVLLFRHADSPLRRRGLSLSQRVNYLHATFTHLSGLQRLTHLLLPVVSLFTASAPVTIAYGHYGLVFLAYFVLSLVLTLLYGRGHYHPVHNDGYHLATIFAHLSGVVGLVRRERRFRSARKQAAHRERTWVKGGLWLLTLVVASAIAVGGWRLAQGDRSGLVVTSTLWAGVHAVWLLSMLGFVERYERRPPPPHQGLAPSDRYDHVMAFARTAIGPA
jgi:cellulose synthase (UDP-forming)